MENTNLNLENNDMFISSHIVPEQLPALLKDALTVAHTTEQKDMLLFDLLPDTQPTEVGIVSGSLQQKQFLESLPMSFSKSDAEHLANTLGLSVKTMNRWLTDWVQTSVLQRLAYGEYAKAS